MKRDKNRIGFFWSDNQVTLKAAFVGGNAGLCISRRSAFRKGDEEEEDEDKDQRMAK